MKRSFGPMPSISRAMLVASVALLALGACSRGSSVENPAADKPEAAAASGGPVAPAEGASIQRLDPALDAIIPPNAVVEKLASGFVFVEGPLWHNNELWFSDLTGNTLYAVTDDGKLRVLMEHAGGLEKTAPGSYQGPNAMVVDKDGSVLLAQHGLRRIARLAPDMTVTPFLERNGDGAHLNSPNDMAFSPDGALWFTDPPMGLLKQDQDPAKEARYNAVYRYKDGKVEAKITDLSRPNGIGFSPDGTKLYISNSAPEMFVNVYDVSPNGDLSKPRRFLSYPGPLPDDVPDGLKVDSKGNIWTTGPGGIRIVSPEGKVLGQIKTPDKAQANIAFGGPDRSTVYITATNNVYRLKVSVPGQKPLYGD